MILDSQKTLDQAFFNAPKIIENYWLSSELRLAKEHYVEALKISWYLWKSNKFIENHKNASNLLLDFLYKNQGFEKTSLFWKFQNLFMVLFGGS